MKFATVLAPALTNSCRRTLLHHKGGSINTGIVDENLTTLFDLPDPDLIAGTDLLAVKLEEINQTLITLTKVINKFNK